MNQNNGTEASAASTNLDSYGAGTGSAELFLLAGPGRDPKFSNNGNQTTVQPSQSNEPSGWTLGSVGAYFFAGQTNESSTADAWQWPANYTNGGDFDKIDAGRING